MIDRAWVSQFADRWRDAGNAHHVDAVLELLTDDVEWIESGVRRTLRGLYEARRRIEADFRHMPDATAEALHVFVDPEADSAAVHWRIRGRYVSGEELEGRPVDFEAVLLWGFVDGRVARLQMIYDVADFRAQAGLDATAPGGSSRRGLTRLTARAREARKR